MANSEHLARLRKDVKAWNKWRTANPRLVPDLFQADLGEANLFAADLREADLREANLRAANLSTANLSTANLSNANLRDADLCAADLSAADLHNVSFPGANLLTAILIGADLRLADLNKANLSAARLPRADLSKADLREANLSWATLSEAKLTKASVGSTIFGDNDLSDVKDLESVLHSGPSTIGIDTIYRSDGKIPEVFLRGAGVPDIFIEYTRSLTGKALEFYSCFISYSTKDQEFADRLYADLQNKGVRCWFAPHDLLPGQKLHEQIDVAIRSYERLLLLLSPHSMNSEWVKTEIRKARKREREEKKKRVLFPVSLVPFDAIRDWELFDADEGKDLAAEIREYYMPPDFSDWKMHDSYTEGLQKLLLGLKTKA